MTSALYSNADHLAPAREFVSLAHAHGSLAPPELQKFWCDNNLACHDPFAPDIPQCPYSPAPAGMRSQHSDSPMGHLLPLLGSLNLTTVYFGHTLLPQPQDIHAHLPRAVIHGHPAPFTFSRNEQVNIVAEFLRDSDATRDRRGLLFATSGPVNNESMLSGMRFIMAAIQRFGRYND